MMLMLMLMLMLLLLMMMICSVFTLREFDKYLRVLSSEIQRRVVR
jgi:hypothetical protein